MPRRYKKILLSLLVVIVSVVISNYQPEQTPLQQVAGTNVTPPGLYKIVAFDDGDTIKVDMEGTIERIRFIGVDTPETHDPRKNVQCFGHAASEFTKNFIGDKPVRLEADPINSNRDRYQRLLRYVYLPDNRLVNAEIIKAGFGFAYTAFPFTKLEEFRAYEQQAREQNKGLWAACSVEVQKNGSVRTSDAL